MTEETGIERTASERTQSACTLIDAGRQTLEVYSPSLTVAPFNDSDFIIKEGDSNISLYVLIKGRVHITKDGNELPLATLYPGAIFGEMSFLSKKPRYSNVVADGAVIVIKMDGEFFRNVPPEIKDKIKDYLIDLLIHRLDAMNEALSKISRFAQCRRLG